MRGILEEMQQLTGMVGSLEHSIYADKMTMEGHIWQPDEEDPTLSRSRRFLPLLTVCVIFAAKVFD